MIHSLRLAPALLLVALIASGCVASREVDLAEEEVVVASAEPFDTKVRLVAFDQDSDRLFATFDIINRGSSTVEIPTSPLGITGITLLIGDQEIVAGFDRKRTSWGLPIGAGDHPEGLKVPAGMQQRMYLQWMIEPELSTSAPWETRWTLSQPKSGEEDTLTLVAPEPKPIERRSRPGPQINR